MTSTAVYLRSKSLSMLHQSVARKMILVLQWKDYSLFQGMSNKEEILVRKTEDT